MVWRCVVRAYGNRRSCAALSFIVAAVRWPVQRRTLTDTRVLAHTARNNDIRSHTSPGGVGAGRRADRDGSRLGWKLPQPLSAEGRPGAFAAELRRIPRWRTLERRGMRPL